VTTNLDSFKYVVTYWYCMFIEVRKAGKGKKYYLVHSFREEGRVVKLRKYLGLNLGAEELKEREARASKTIIDQLKYYREIRDPLRYVLSPNEVKQLKALEASGDLRIAHLSEDDWRRFSELFSYHTNAIEGSTLTQREVTALIEHDTIPDKSAQDVAEARGVVLAIENIRKKKPALSVELIRLLHRLVFKETKDFAGELRPLGVEVVIRDGQGVVVHRGAPSQNVEKLLQELVAWYEKNKKKYSGILLAAVVHDQFENIHPFQDGNGRVGRLLMNAILLKHRLPPINIELSHRQEYYRTLQEYQNKGNIRPTIELMLKEYKHLKKKLQR